jgi:FkbM family methyltransferase
VTEKCRIVAFEPSPVMARMCESTLSAAGVPVRVVQKGLAEASRRLKFDSSGAAPHMAAIRETGDTEIETVALDDILADEKVTFVKLDIEGFEIPALQGMRHIVQTQRPKLAVSVYHRPEDIVEIPRYLASLRDDYTFYLRHYSYNLSELVLYAI